MEGTGRSLREGGKVQRRRADKRRGDKKTYLKKVLTRGQYVRIRGGQGVSEAGVVIVVGHLVMGVMSMVHSCHRSGCDPTV